MSERSGLQGGGARGEKCSNDLQLYAVALDLYHKNREKHISCHPLIRV